MPTMRGLLSEVDFMDEGLRPMQVSAGEVVYPPRGRLGPRWQRDAQLVLMHSGSVIITVDGQARPVLPAGSVGLLLPGHSEVFAFAAATETHHAWVQVRIPEPCNRLLERLATLPVAMSASGDLTDLVRHTVAAARSPISTASQLLGALAAATLWRYVGDAESRARIDQDDLVDRARRFLDTHLADPSVDLREVAAAAHVSPPHLVRRFRARLGTTPIAYLWQRRTAAGIDLLIHTGLPVHEIASRSGFKSVYHFSRTVRKHTGLSPVQLRRARWNVP
jgi:AraC-like DNA-binding protein